MNEATKKTLIAAGAACGTAVITSYLTTKYLVKVALDRKEPRILKRADKMISGSKKTDKNFIKELKEASERLEQTENELVNITAHDGTPLVGHWFEREHPDRIIIAMHGWRASWNNDFGTVYDFWHDNGCSVLMPEQRGQNGSGGDFIGFGVTEQFDVLDWIEWVTNRCGNNIPVYLCGVSMGATTVLMASGLELPDNVCGIIADCGFTSPAAIWRHVANNNLHLTYGIRSVFADLMFRSRINVPLSKYSTVDALKKCTVPVMFVHGADDHFVPVSMTFENYKACNSPKKLLIVPGADHGMSYYLNKDEYEKNMLDFWCSCETYLCSIRKNNMPQV